MSDRFYSTHAWHKMRSQIRKRDGYRCGMCGKGCPGKGASHVDHKVSRRSAPHLALEPSNLWLLCSHCHNSTKQKDEIDPNRGVNADGTPRDPSHAWHK